MLCDKDGPHRGAGLHRPAPDEVHPPRGAGRPHDRPGAGRGRAAASPRSPRGKTNTGNQVVVSGSGNIRIWEPSSGEELPGLTPTPARPEARRRRPRPAPAEEAPRDEDDLRRVQEADGRQQQDGQGDLLGGRPRPQHALPQARRDHRPRQDPRHRAARGGHLHQAATACTSSTAPPRASRTSRWRATASVSVQGRDFYAPPSRSSTTSSRSRSSSTGPTASPPC